MFSSFSWEMANKQFLQSGLIFKHDTRFNVESNWNATSIIRL